MDEIDTMTAAGLRPTPRDIVRLNAMGLKVEAANEKNPCMSLFFLPRVAAIGDSLTFRQPTIGHEIWIGKVERFVKSDDPQTVMAVKAFALSRGVDDLPDAETKDAVVRAVNTFCDECRDLCRDQIFAALEYVIFGADETALEDAPTDEFGFPKDEEKYDGTQGQDWRACVAVGVLFNAQAVLVGVTAAELRRMTRRQVRELTQRALAYRGMAADPDANAALCEFYATRDEIKKRLTAEIAAADEKNKEDGDGGCA